MPIARGCKGPPSPPFLVTDAFQESVPGVNGAPLHDSHNQPLRREEGGKEEDMSSLLPDSVTLALAILAATYASVWIVVIVSIVLDRARRRLTTHRS